MINEQYNFLEGYRFIDLFAGIGGFHYALESFGAQCVFASEWDKYAAETYHNNFGIYPEGDITQIEEVNIPEHDILCAGFPCQAFSISGKQQGFEDTRGTLFFDIVRIANHHRPKILFLENVKNLAKHDGGKTLKVILSTLDGIGYDVNYKVLNTSNFGLPQNRERIYIVAFRKDLNINNFMFPDKQTIQTCLYDILEREPNAKIIQRDDIKLREEFVGNKDLWGEIKLLNKPIQVGIVNKGGQGERIYHPLGHAITLSAYGGGVGAKTGLYIVNDVIRKLSPRECARLQGFPDSFVLNKSDSQSYKQFGNSVSIDVLQHILIEIDKALHNNG